MTNKKQKNIRYIGIVGMPLSGKDTSGEYISEKYEFIAVNMHSIVSEEAKKRKIEPTRDNFQKIGTELRKKEGESVIANRIYNDWIPHIEMNIYRANETRGKTTNFDKLKYVIMGIRNYEEVNYFREKFNDNFILIAVLSPQKLRFERSLKRKRKGFDTNLSYEEFKKQDNYEISKLNLGSSIAIADYYIINEGNKNELFSNIDKILTSIIHN